jgi:signal transduction histidine kinase
MHLIHDVRLVLIALAACLESLRRPDGKPLPQEFAFIDRLLEVGFAIVDELLMSGEHRSAATHVDVNRLLEETDAIVSTIVGSDITVRTTLGESESRIYARRGDIERILLNLVFNAAAAMPYGGELLIETSASDPAPSETARAPFGDLRLAISDTGRGMSDVELARAINPSARPRPDGTGLGLACVALIVHRLGGRLGINNRKDGGTVVTVSLPLSPPASHKIH